MLQVPFGLSTVKTLLDQMGDRLRNDDYYRQLDQYQCIFDHFMMGLQNNYMQRLTISHHHIAGNNLERARDVSINKLCAWGQ